ncbi:MAG: hypothetical protein GC158_15375 [Cyanobacteria bacterium RI_101]|nr:hypothetical protein [Cyanobacteria bacterium RI_101]
MKMLLQKIAIATPISILTGLLPGVFFPATAQVISFPETLTHILTEQGTGDRICFDGSSSSYKSSCNSNEFSFSNFIFTSLASSDGVTINTITLSSGQLSLPITFSALGGFAAGDTLSYIVQTPSSLAFSQVSSANVSGGDFATEYCDNSSCTPSSIGTISQTSPSAITLNPTKTSLFVENTIEKFDGFSNVVITNSYQTVPWETDALPLVGATALFAGGVWWKQKRGKKTDISEQLSVSSEQSSDASD